MITKQITSLQHPFIKHLVKLRTDKLYRKEHNQVVISGKKLLTELSDLKIILSDNPEVPPLKAEEIIIVTSGILKKITGLENPEAIAGVVELPPNGDLRNKRYLLALDRISDPGNLGTLLRTALALGWDGVFLIEGCADPFNDKALRAAKGATFQIPLRSGSWEELEQLALDNKMEVVVADGEGTPLGQHKLTPPLILLLGNESHGVRPGAKKAFPTVAIPMHSGMESLNVAIAGALLMHHLRGS